MGTCAAPKALPAVVARKTSPHLPMSQRCHKQKQNVHCCTCVGAWLQVHISSILTTRAMQLANTSTMHAVERSALSECAKSKLHKPLPAVAASNDVTKRCKPCRAPMLSTSQGPQLSQKNQHSYRSAAALKESAIAGAEQKDLDPSAMPVQTLL